MDFMVTLASELEAFLHVDGPHGPRVASKVISMIWNAPHSVGGRSRGLWWVGINDWCLLLRMTMEL